MKTTLRLPGFIVAMAAIGALGAPSAHGQEGKDWRYLRPEKAALLAKLRSEALHGDRAHLPDIMEILRQAAAAADMNEANPLTALRAAIQLQATEAIPLIRQVQAANSAKTYIACFAKVAQARIAAETEVEQEQTSAPTSGPTLALRKIFRMMEHLDLTHAQLAAGVQARYKMMEAYNKSGTFDGRSDWNVEMVAAEEIADLLYRQPGATAEMADSFKDIDCSKDIRAALKLKLVPLSKQERIAWLIDAIAHLKLGDIDNYDFAVQLAADEGTPAAALAAKQVQALDTERKKYSSMHYANYNFLFEIIDAVGDTAFSQIVRTYQADKNGIISTYPYQNGGAITGTKYQYAPGY